MVLSVSKFEGFFSVSMMLPTWATLGDVIVKEQFNIFAQNNNNNSSSNSINLICLHKTATTAVAVTAATAAI